MIHWKKAKNYITKAFSIPSIRKNLDFANEHKTITWMKT